MDVIHTYTRKEAIEDGVLMDASELAKEAGFKYPVALTAAVWNTYVVVPDGLEGQDETGRLWDILWMLLFHIKWEKPEGPVTLFKLHVANDLWESTEVVLRSVCHGGDDAEPVITIMLPEED